MFGCRRWLCISTSRRSWCSTWDCLSWLLNSTFSATIWLLCFPIWCSKLVAIEPIITCAERKDFSVMNLSFQTIHYIIHASKSSKFKLQIVFSAGDDQMTMEPEKKGRKYDQMLWEISESLLQYIPFFPWPDTHDQTFLFQEAFQCRNHWASIASPPLRPSKESVITSICNIKSCESSKDPSYATNRPEPLDSYHIKTIIPQKKSTINFSVCSNS